MSGEMRHRIASVEEGSIADELGIVPGCVLTDIGGEAVKDIFDYRYMIRAEYIELGIEDNEGEYWVYEIEKDEDEDLGIDFGPGLMDEYRSCSNACIFCFIDQMPKGMRDTLYFKDDDTRLSFLQGNYVTLTNMSDDEIDRILKYHLSPINISFHTTNPELRIKMLRNRFAGEALEKAKRLAAPGTGIELNGQIVLCKGINDGKELERSLDDLFRDYRPSLRSVSVVPAGLTRYRERLFDLKPFDREDARAVIDMVEAFQKRSLEMYGDHFAHASDEWYLLAERELPEAESYDGYVQLENGVGMLRLFMDEYTEALTARVDEIGKRASKGFKRDVDVVTGKLAESSIRALTSMLCERLPGLNVRIHAVRNDFFGERITVGGLLTGTDIIAQTRGKLISKELLLPENVLRFGEDVLLDDIRVCDIERELGVTVRIVPGSGEEYLLGLLGDDGLSSGLTGAYELS